MAVRILTRKIRMELTSEELDICELLFMRKRAQHACRLFLKFLKINNGLSRSQVAKFAADLDAGRIEPGFKYSRRTFYAQIRRTLLTTGLIQIVQKFNFSPSFDFEPERKHRKDFIEMYVPVRQPIPKRPPDGVNLPRLVWIICKKWNEQFQEDNPI